MSALSPAEAMALSAMAVASREDRIRLLRTGSPDELAAMLSALLDLVEQVETNAHEWVGTILVAEGALHPHRVDNINLPTLLGALNGIQLAAQVDQRGTCHGCAYRLGSIANQCLSTTLDADYMGRNGEGDFYCHEKLDNRGEPVKLCVGHAKVNKAKATSHDEA